MIPAGIGIMAPAAAPWSALEVALVFAMWAVMMVGMMLPSAAPMILLYAQVGRRAASPGKPLAPTGWFAAGYVAVWIGFAMVAAAAQVVLERAALLTPTMQGASSVLGGIVLIATGVYQWTPLKESCLTQCRSPLHFIPAAWWVSPLCSKLLCHRRQAWGVLRWLLLGWGFCSPVV